MWQPDHSLREKHPGNGRSYYCILENHEGFFNFIIQSNWDNILQINKGSEILVYIPCHARRPSLTHGFKYNKYNGNFRKKKG